MVCYKIIFLFYLRLLLIKIYLDDTINQIVQQAVEDEGDSSKKSKPSGKKADQQKMYNKFNTFLINNIRRANDEEETFSGFDTGEDLEEDEVINKLQTIVNNINNNLGGFSFYRSLISFYLLRSKNSKIVKKNLIEIVKNKGKRSKMGKLSKRFYILAKNCGKDRWKQCDIGPSYFHDLNKDKWSELLNKFNIIENEEDSEDE